jgi:hypothetical protein
VKAVETLAHVARLKGEIDFETASEAEHDIGMVRLGEI